MAVSPPTPYFPLARAKERSRKSRGALASCIKLFQRLNFPGPDESLSTHAGSKFRTAGFQDRVFGHSPPYIPLSQLLRVRRKSQGSNLPRIVAESPLQRGSRLKNPQLLSPTISNEWLPRSCFINIL